MTDKAALQKLFGPIAEKYANRNGGYTRIIKIGNRRGDDAPMAFIELVEGEVVKGKDKKAAPAKAAAPKKKAAASKAADKDKKESAPKAKKAAPKAKPADEEKKDSE